MWKHPLVTHHLRHKFQQTPNNPKHRTQNHHRLHRRHKYPTSTHRNTNTPTQYPLQTPCITTQTKDSTPTHPLHSLKKHNPNRRQMKQTIFENTSFTTNLDANPTNTTETTVQRNIKEIHHS